MTINKTGSTALLLAWAIAGNPALGHGHPPDAKGRLAWVTAQAERALLEAERNNAWQSAMHAEQAWLMLESHPELRTASIIRSAVSQLREASANGQAGDAELARVAAAHAIDALRRYAARRPNEAS